MLIACWLYVVTLSTLAQSTCRPNGPASTKCLAFPPNSRAFEPRLFELKSLFPGNGISWTETKAPKQARKFEDAFAETGPRKEAGQFGASAENREISVSVGVRGGLGRTRTSHQAVMRQWPAIARPNHKEISIR